MRTSRSRDIYCGLRAIHATETAWSACYTTRCWEQSRFSRMGNRFTIRTITRQGRRSTTRTNGRVVRARCRRLWRITAYFHGPQGVFVNLYVPSTLRWQENGGSYSLEQATEYPYSGQIRINVTASRPRDFAVFLRIPEWAKGARVSVNGMRGNWKAAPGSFAEIRRSWKTGDRIELELPLPVRLEAVDAQHPNQVALVRGPLVLMALTNLPAGLEGKA